MATSRAKPKTKKQMVWNDHNKKEHEEKIRREQQKLKTKKLNEFDQTEMTEKIEREKDKVNA